MYGYFLPCIVIYGSVGLWSCIVIYGPIWSWSCIVIYGPIWSWSCMVKCVQVWSFMHVYGQVKSTAGKIRNSGDMGIMVNSDRDKSF